MRPGLKGAIYYPYLNPITPDLAILHPKYTIFSQVSLKNKLRFLLEIQIQECFTINLHKITNKGMHSVHPWIPFVCGFQESVFKIQKLG